MKIAHLQRREPHYEETLFRTLSTGWSAQHGAEVRVTRPDTQEGDLWLAQSRLSFYYRADLSPRARHFLRCIFRYNRARRGQAAQWIAGSLLTSRTGLRALGRPAFRVSPPLPSVRDLVVVPGNHRLRVFDFHARTSRLLLKQGFDPLFNRREVEVRGTGDGPFPRLLAWAGDHTWLEEPIVDAVPLVRWRSGAELARLKRRAVDRLREWLEGSRREVPVERRVTQLLHEVHEDLQVAGSLLPGCVVTRMRAWAPILTDLALRRGSTPQARVHGDFSPNNILVQRDTKEVLVVDWEYSQERLYWYDELVLRLGSRFALGLAGRLRTFAASGGGDWSPEITRWSRAERHAVLALFLLEDLQYELRNAVTAQFAGGAEVAAYVRELATFGSRLEGLFAG